MSEHGDLGVRVPGFEGVVRAEDIHDSNDGVRCRIGLVRGDEKTSIQGAGRKKKQTSYEGKKQIPIPKKKNSKKKYVTR